MLALRRCAARRSESDRGGLRRAEGPRKEVQTSTPSTSLIHGIHLSLAHSRSAYAAQAGAATANAVSLLLKAISQTTHA